jgi:hypothetical protein
VIASGQSLEQSGSKPCMLCGYQAADAVTTPPHALGTGCDIERDCERGQQAQNDRDSRDYVSHCAICCTFAEIV